MITLLLSSSMMISTMFILMNHPLSMGMTLLIQTILISLITGNFISSLWFSYILFLILIGGMLILFMYMTSIASNEKFKPQIKELIPLMLLPMFYLTIKPYCNNLTSNNELNVMNKTNCISNSLAKYAFMPTSLILTLMIMYLLITLVATVKITQFKKGPIRQMN
uniref:NADH-ubiquinone oxidoreductase chain 6 n=1 Tax=Tribolium confusum TaxID=7071 RepID=A0A0U1Z9N4_TRICF|nr:NADH dehydrogenase subunit 6 [Tribolium confusum]AJP09532.1 NADH dehydrogenase subunit 6 [Tribolium confusum]